MDFLVEFEVNIGCETPESQVLDHERAEASAAAKLVAGRRPRRAPGLRICLGLTNVPEPQQLEELGERFRHFRSIVAATAGPPLPNTEPSYYLHVSERKGDDPARGPKDGLREQ